MPSPLRFLFVTGINFLPDMSGFGAVLLTELNNIDVRFQAWPEGEIVSADAQPVVRPLVNVEASTNLNAPTITEQNLTIMQSAVFPDNQRGIGLLKAIADRV